jgi:vitamin K-dependent gamma-carboxylase
MMPAAPNTDNTATTPAQRSAPQRLIERLTARAYRPVPSDFLIYFRLVFAAVMLSYVVMYFRNGYIDMYYVDPKFHFTWYGFSWVRPWSPTGMHVHYAVMGVLCVLMAIGLFYRLAAAAFALCFTYVFLLDKVQYQNHYYLIMMLSWIMAILNKKITNINKLKTPKKKFIN